MPTGSSCCASISAASNARSWPASARTMRPRRSSADRSSWWRTSSRRCCAGSRARACCSRRRAATVSCWCAPTTRSPRARWCGSAGRGAARGHTRRARSGRGLIGPPIVAEGLRREFGGIPVLAGIDLTVDPGGLGVPLGANGAGKTTLLRVLATLLRPSGGTLRLFGEDASRRPPAARRRVGHVGHESACYPDLTGRENLRFYAELHGVPDPESRITELLRWAGLEEAARRAVRVDSRGMAQRLGAGPAVPAGPRPALPP